MSSTALFNLSTAPVTGTWTNNNSLGFTFDAVSTVTITHLGIFDSAGDGIGSARTVRIHAYPSGTLVASATFSPGDGTLEGVFRYLAITPITLSPGTYRIAGGSFTSPDPGWQSGDGGTWSETQVGGRILTGLAYVGTADTMPTSPFTKFTRVGASLKAQDEGIAPAMAMTVSANLSAVAAVAATPAMAMSVSADLTAGSAMTASPAMVMSVTAPLSGTGALESSPTMAMSVTAQPVGVGPIDSAPTMAMSVSADLTDLADPSATFTMAMTTTADLTGVIVGDAYTLQAQRTAWEVEPGYLPGQCGFNGSAPLAFGDSADEIHSITDIVFVGLFRGGSVGQIIGSVTDMPVNEISETDIFSTVTTYSTPIPVGYFHPITSSFAVTTDPIQGPTANIGDGETYGTKAQINSQIDNSAGTPTTADVIPRTRELLYNRLWTAGPPEGTLLAMAVSVTGRVVRAYRDTSDDIVLEFWRRTGWDAITTSLNTTGNGAMCYDHQDSAGRLWLVLEESGGIKSRYTDDEGGTWSVAVTIASSGNDPALWVSPTGLRHYFWRDSAAIKTKVLDSQDTAVVATTTVVASGVADSPIDALYDGSLWHLTYRNTSNAVVTVVSSDGGLTFS